MIKKDCKKLDKLNIDDYIYIIMQKIKDTLLIRWFIDFCIEKDFNQSRMAKEVGMSRSWASMLINGQIKSLRFDTRNRIKNLLGIQ